MANAKHATTLASTSRVRQRGWRIVLTNRLARSRDRSRGLQSHARGLGFDPHVSTGKPKTFAEMRTFFVFGTVAERFSRGEWRVGCRAPVSCRSISKKTAADYTSADQTQ